ncbi:MAG: hypothetical protein ACI88L_000004 [Candidatus Paceibacteria bacterium]|jgi:hypothetical protein
MKVVCRKRRKTIAMNYLAIKALKQFEKLLPELSLALDKKTENINESDKQVLNRSLGILDCVFFRGKSEDYFRILEGHKHKGNIRKIIKDQLGYNY